MHDVFFGSIFHTFKNMWTPEVVAATADATYTAVFTETLNTYTVTWKNWNGDVLKTDENVPYGTTPTYDGETPTKEPADGKTFEFLAWNPQPGPIAGDTTYTATFKESGAKASVISVAGGVTSTTFYTSLAEALDAE